MNILIQYPHIVVLALWFLVSLLALLRYFNYPPIARLSWKMLLLSAIVLHVAYGLFLTWGQYVEWQSTPFTKTFLTQPLPSTVPLPFFLEWARPLFEHGPGYFAFYALGRFWINILIILGLTGFFAMLLKLRAYYRPWNFKEGEILAISLALLISGWPGVVVLLPLAFLFAVVFSIISSTMYGISRTYLTPAFLVAAPVALLLGTFILKSVKLYTLLKI